MELAAQFLNYYVSPLELQPYDNYVQIKLRDFRASNDFFPFIFCFIIMYIYVQKRNNILVIYVSSGCKFFVLSLSFCLSRFASSPTPIPPLCLTTILSEVIVIHHHSYMHVSVRKPTPTHMTQLAMRQIRHDTSLSHRRRSARKIRIAYL